MKKLLWILAALMVALCLASPVLADEVVNVFNWEDYIDESVLRQFEQETGIHVNYMRFTTNEDMMVQVEANPGAFDVVFPSDYMVERMLNKGLLEKLDYSKLPNASNLLENLKNPSYDPDNAYSLPYMWGTVGIVYNKTMVTDPVDSWGILWNENYRNNIFMLDSIRDSFGVTLKYLGYSMNTNDILALESTKEKLIEQKRAGLVKAYQVDEVKDKMVAGEAALAVMWSGDAQYAIELNPDLGYAIPKEGSNIWVDCMVMPAAAKNKENAARFIDFLFRPDIAQKNCEAIHYSSPNQGAIDAIGEAYTANPVMNPAPEDVARCEYFNDIAPDYMMVYNALWQEVKNAK